MANIPIQFSFTTQIAQSARQVDEEDAFRILVVADLGCSVSARAVLPLAQRKPLRVDIDNFDSVFKRLAPCLALTLDGTTLGIEFLTFDDFHPDRLFASLAPFAALRKLRGELADPAQFHRAAAALGAAPAAVKSPGVADDAAQSNDIERLLGRKPSAAPAALPAGSGLNLDNWLRTVVAPHVVPNIANEQAQLIAAVDSAIGTEMRRVLHHPAFQTLEANWRSIEHLVRGLELGDTLELALLDATRDELAQDIAAHAADMSRSALHHHLCGPQTEAPAGKRWSLLVSDLSIGADMGELHLLATLGAMAGRAGAPLLAAAHPSLLGCASVDQLIDPKTWQPLDADLAAFWAALRQSPVAPWIGLALPRVLVRLPYGKRSDPVTTFAFEEIAAREHEVYLWGSPAFALAQLAGEAFMEAGWSMELAAGLDLDDLPSHIYHDDGESHQQPCAEVTLPESAGNAMLRKGAMALLSYRNRNAARLLRWQSIAEPGRVLQGAWV